MSSLKSNIDSVETESPSSDGFSAQVAQAISVLETIRDDRRLLAKITHEQKLALLVAAGQVARPGPWQKRELARAARKKRREQVRDSDEQVLAQSGIRKQRKKVLGAAPVFGQPPISPSWDAERLALPSTESSHVDGKRRLNEPRTCYICKQGFQTLHHFYDSMCPKCAAKNYTKRHQHADLSGRVALITGARVKIGYQAALMLLRAGASVVVTTRFPRDAAARYAREDDFSQWQGRLQIYGLDLRHTPSIEEFAKHIVQTKPRLDFVLNNACQTVRRPVGFYRHLVEAERQELALLPPPTRALVEDYEANQRAVPREGHGTLVEVANRIGVADPVALSQLALLEDDLERSTHIFPQGSLDEDLQQVDLRATNSWRLTLADVSAVELLEVQLVNAVAPYILNARLKPLMMRHRSDDKHIVNVSAMEGQFYRSYKTDKHPHTNMAKAALNMMTRTSAIDYVNDGIHMNSVDTGWITDEDPAALAARKTEELGFHPPLDAIDGAARICDPIFSGFLSGKHVWGLFLKDYAPTAW